MYGVLKEAEHRSTFYIPYWNLPFAKNLVPRQRQFYTDLKVINDCLDDLIAQAKNTRQTEDAEALQARDYSKVTGLFGLPSDLLFASLVGVVSPFGVAICLLPFVPKALPRILASYLCLPALLPLSQNIAPALWLGLYIISIQQNVLN